MPKGKFLLQKLTAMQAVKKITPPPPPPPPTNKQISFFRAYEQRA